MCIVLKVTRGAYYFWIKRIHSKRKKEDDILIFRNKENSSRIGKYLWNTKNKSSTYSDHNLKICPNRLKQNFSVQMPNKIYVGDITYIGIEEGWLYLATVEDLFNREIVGWSLNSTMTRNLLLMHLLQL